MSRRRAVDRGSTCSPPRHTYFLQRGPAIVHRRACLRRTPTGPWRTSSSCSPKIEVYTFIQQLRRHMDQLRLTQAARHASPGTFVHKDLPDSSHVFLRQDGSRRALQPPYSGPHQVIARTDKTLEIFLRGRHVNVSIDRVKPAYLLRDDHPDNGSRPVQSGDAPPQRAATLPELCQSTFSGRTLRYPAPFLT